MNLTARQRDLMLFLQSYEDEHQACPSFDEMKAALGILSKSGVHRLITALEERGFIRRLHHRARSIEILRRIDHKLSTIERDDLINAMDDRVRAEHPMQATLPSRAYYVMRLDEWLATLDAAGFRIVRATRSTARERFSVEQRGEPNG